jgi:hypothetical protein
MKDILIPSRGKQLWIRILIAGIVLGALCIREVPPAQAQKGDLRMAVDVTASPDIYEPDDTNDLAHLIASGATETHSISPETDVDWVKFKLTIKSAISIETMSTDPHEAPLLYDTDLSLYDSNMNLITENDDKMPGTLWSFIQQCGAAAPTAGGALLPGTYYIKIIEQGQDREIPSYNLVFKKNSGCLPTTDIYIAGALQGKYTINPTRAAGVSYFGIQNGPVKVHSSTPFAASERGFFGMFYTYNEVMGYPNNQLTTHYWFPWYDDVNMITWVLVGNPSTTQTANVTIKMAGTTMGTYAIPPFGNITPRFGVENGPVEIISNISVFASQRVLMGWPSGAQSFDEVLGYPHNKLTSHYWFTWYDDKDMQTSIMVGNPNSTKTAHVTIKIAGVKQGTYPVAPKHTLAQAYENVQSGPVEVISDIAVFASERGIFGDAPYQTFNEVVGYPHNQLTNNYWFPWYDNVHMINWVLVGNPSPSKTAHVTIKIAGVTVGTYNIPPYGNVTPTFDGWQTGPVQVISNVVVFTSERGLYGWPGTGASFNEILGMANNKLTTDYWFTWYDGLDMTTSVNIGRP